MTYDLIPPTEFYSRQWFEGNGGFGMRMISNGLSSRIDSTRNKLISLEIKLFDAKRNDPFNFELSSCWLTVAKLRRDHIGVWSPRHSTNSGGWDAQMVYPNTKQVISQWPEEILGERKKDDGLLLILLSPSSVDWLNTVDRWVSNIHSATTV